MKISLVSRTGQVSDAGAAFDEFTAFYQAQWWPMLRLAQGLVDDVAAAEDVTQDAFAALYHRRDQLLNPAAATRYVRVSVVNGARSALRRRRTARTRLHLLADDSEPAADERALRGADQETARNALARLPGRQREVLTLRFIGGLTDPEIAEAIGTSAGNVRSAASRGLATLRATLKEWS